MKAQAALVRADGAVHLDAETAVDLELALVVDPGHPEHDDALGFHDALQNLVLGILGILGDEPIQGFEDLPDRLMELQLARVLCLDLFEQLFNHISSNSFGYDRSIISSVCIGNAWPIYRQCFAVLYIQQLLSA